MLAVLTLVAFAAAQHTTDTLPDVKKTVAENKAILVDVREAAEWADGHLKDAVHVPLSGLKDGLPAGAKENLATDKPVYLHCASGRRSLKAAEALKKFGYDARPLKDGYDDLLAAGFEKAAGK